MTDQLLIGADLQAALLGEGDQGVGQGLGRNVEGMVLLQQCA
ncbi:hypothetical protein [Pseudomonas argentinensis]|nr:hypothetical protein [Pseudomonas argentinensis]